MLAGAWGSAREAARSACGAAFTLHGGPRPQAAPMTKRHDARAALSAQPAPWSEVVLVCQKCMRRQDREQLRGELRKALKHAGRRDVRTVLVGFLDVCPEDGVAVARGSGLAARPPRLHVLDNDAPVEALVRWAVD